VYRTLLRCAWTVAAAACAIAAATPASACPFCSAVSMTFSDELAASEVGAIIQLVKRPSADDLVKADPATALGSKSTFEVVRVLKGDDRVSAAKQIEIFYFGEQSIGTQFLAFGNGMPDVVWTTPTAMSERGVEYISRLTTLPAEGPDRLAFFLDHLEDEDPLLATDSYDEFAKAPYSDVKAIEPSMDHGKILGWIQHEDVPASRRRLYLTLLGVCGGEADIPVLESMIRSEEQQMRTALDAMIACYLNLRGPEGMPLVEDLFLKNPKAEYTDTYSAIMALRFHGQETEIIPRERLLEGFRHILDRPMLADLVIPDLARWEDWSVTERLVELFKNADEDEGTWVRVPVVNFLRASPEPRAKELIEELAKVDPQAVERASRFFPIPSAAPSTTNVAETEGSDAANGPDAGEETVDTSTPTAEAASSDATSSESESSAGELLASAATDSVSTDESDAPPEIKLATAESLPKDSSNAEAAAEVEEPMVPSAAFVGLVAATAILVLLVLTGILRGTRGGA